MPRVLVLGVALATCASTASAFTFSAQVVRIADGDSFTVRDDHGRRFELRLHGIDAPEGKQPYGPAARNSLNRLIAGKAVVIVVDDVDRYGRLIARVRSNALDLGLAQIEAGFAWSYPWAGLPADEKKRYAAAEKRARLARAGLWSDREPVAPWVFRRTAREGRRDPGPGEIATGPVIGNRSSKVYHRPDCPGYSAVSARNRVSFSTGAEAERAGYRLAGNCPD